MKDQWEIDWTLEYGGLAHAWGELTPQARRRLRRLVGQGQSRGPLTGEDFQRGR